MMRVLTVCVALLLLCGCPRTFPEGQDPAAMFTGAHAWDSPGYRGPELELQRRFAEEQQQAEIAAGGGALPAAPGRGPEFPAQDTLIPEQMYGAYLVAGLSSGEQQFLLPVGEQDTFRFDSGGFVTFGSLAQWKESVQDGRWRKLRPGVITLTFGGAAPAEFHGQLFRDDFLYIWNYEQKSGFWMARLPEQAEERLRAGRYETSRGTLEITEVVGASLTGRVTGRQQMTVSGYYNRGILSLRWEMDDRTGTGFAAFIVSPDGKRLKGAWWVDDYEAAPFGGEWDGTAL
jgi:hypothetical protein